MESSVWLLSPHLVWTLLTGLAVLLSTYCHLCEGLQCVRCGYISKDSDQVILEKVGFSHDGGCTERNFHLKMEDDNHIRTDCKLCQKSVQKFGTGTQIVVRNCLNSTDSHKVKVVPDKCSSVMNGDTVLISCFCSDSDFCNTATTTTTTTTTSPHRTLAITTLTTLLVTFLM